MRSTAGWILLGGAGALLIALGIGVGMRLSPVPVEQPAVETIGAVRETGPRVIGQIPVVTVVDEQGEEWSTESLRGGYAVMVFGCLTCTPYLDALPGLEAVVRDYKPRGVQFVWVYRRLIHPGFEGYLSPTSLDERLQHVEEMRKRFPTAGRWVSDTLEGDLEKACEGRRWVVQVLDPEGGVIHRDAVYSDLTLRAVLSQVVGPVAEPTPAESIARIRPPAPRFIGTKRPPLKRPDALVPLRTQSGHGPDSPVKLVAQAEPSLLEDGQGKLYLGFHLDRLQGMSWNNQAGPLRWMIEPTAGIEVEPEQGVAWLEEAPEDDAPREFLVSVRRREGRDEESLSVKAWYGICQKAGGLCRLEERHFVIELRRDPDEGYFAFP